MSKNRSLEKFDLGKCGLITWIRLNRLQLSFQNMIYNCMRRSFCSHSWHIANPYSIRNEPRETLHKFCDSSLIV